jgi:hypothetical protein
MILELITPLMIATAPAQIKAPEALVYSHEQQAVALKDAVTVAQRTTWNGTQTFDWNGRPNDADND